MTAKEKMQNKIAKTNSNLPVQKTRTIADYITAMTPEIAKALPSHLKPERLARIVTTEIRRNPKLLECTRESLLGALMLSAQLGLEPGPLGHVYYIPYSNKKTGVTECQFILG
jgi:recombination protein RecT